MGPTTRSAEIRVAARPARPRSPRPAANRRRWRTPATSTATATATTATVRRTARPAWAGVPPRKEPITSDGPTASIPFTATSDHSAAPHDWAAWWAVKNRAMRVRLPGRLVSCCTTGGTHMTTRATAPATVRPMAHPAFRRPGSAGAGTRRWRRAVTAHPTVATATTTATTGRHEMLVWTTKLPTSQAPSRDSPDRASEAAASSSRSSSGKITTVGFHGLTSAPSAASE